MLNSLIYFEWTELHRVNHMTLGQFIFNFNSSSSISYHSNTKWNISSETFPRVYECRVINKRRAVLGVWTGHTNSSACKPGTNQLSHLNHDDFCARCNAQALIKHAWWYQLCNANVYRNKIMWCGDAPQQAVSHRWNGGDSFSSAAPVQRCQSKPVQIDTSCVSRKPPAPSETLSSGCPQAGG